MQTGDAAAADRAFEAAARAFACEVPDRPLAQWPQCFWSTLLATAPLRAPTSGRSGWGALTAGPRAALLLRWAGGLDDATAAQALGVSQATFQLALRRALDAAGDEAPALQAEVDACLAESGAPAPAGRNGPPDQPLASPPRALLAVLWVLLAACVVAFAATFVPRDGGDGSAARVVPLPETPPAARYDAPAALVVHRDFALLVDAEAEPWLDDFEFHAWLAAGAPGPVDVHDAAQPAGPGFAPTVPDGALETLDAPL